MKNLRLFNKKTSAVIAAALALLMLLFAFSSFADDDIWGEGTTAAETAQNTTNEAAFEESETAAYSKADFYLRIGIYYMNSAVSSLELSSNDGFILADCKRDGFTEIKDLRGYKTLKAVPAGKTTDIYDAAGNLICGGISGYQGLISAAPETPVSAETDSVFLHDHSPANLRNQKPSSM